MSDSAIITIIILSIIVAIGTILLARGLEKVMQHLTNQDEP